MFSIFPLAPNLPKTNPQIYPEKRGFPFAASDCGCLFEGHDLRNNTPQYQMQKSFQRLFERIFKYIEVRQQKQYE